MRLREIQWILKAALPKLTVTRSNRRGVRNETYENVADLFQAEEALAELSKIDLFTQRAQKLAKEKIFSTVYDQADFLSEHVDRAEPMLNDLRFTGQNLLSAINQVLPEELPNSFSIHLPLAEPLSLKDFTEEVESLGAIFEQPLRRFAHTDMRLSTADSGSVVLEFAVGVGEVAAAITPALKAVGLIVGGSYAHLLFRQRLSQEAERTKMMAFQTQEARAKALLAEEQLNAIKLESHVHQTAVEICMNFEEESGENFVIVVSQSVRRLTDKLEIGVQVKLASNAPKSVLAHAPPQMLPPNEALQPSPDPSPPKQLTAGQAEEQEDVEDGKA